MSYWKTLLVEDVMSVVQSRRFQLSGLRNLLIMILKVTLIKHELVLRRMISIFVTKQADHNHKMPLRLVPVFLHHSSSCARCWRE